MTDNNEHKTGKHLYMGIDPGARGAVYMVSPDGTKCSGLNFSGKNVGEHEIAEFFRDVAPYVKKAVLEKAHSSPQMGVKSAFNYGQNFAMLRTFLNVFMIPWEYVTVRSWQKAMGITSTGNSGFGKGTKQTASKDLAKRLYPEVKVTAVNCDAIILAEYIRRRETGQL